MTIRSFVVSLFQGLRGLKKEEVEQVKGAARGDAQAVVSTYLSEFNLETHRLLHAYHNQFTAGLLAPPVNEEDVCDVEYKVVSSEKPVRKKSHARR
jgi:hypothetical protein